MNEINVINPQIIKNRKVRSISIAKNIKYFEKSDSIRFALRNYFCDFIFNKKAINWNKENCENKYCETKTEEQNIEIHEKVFAHNFTNDFKLTIYFPKIFENLWKLFGYDVNDLLISLTFLQLEGFNNPAKSGANFFSSWDKKYFLKNVLSEPKWYKKIKKIDKMNFIKKFKEIFESEIEKDFFFNEEEKKKKNILEEEEEEQNNNLLLLLTPQKSPSGYINENNKKLKFKGSFLKYFNYLEQQQITLLPKFFLLFTITTLNNLNQSEIFSIQNGLFPEGTPKIDLIFDLKGSKRKLQIEKGFEKFKIKRKSPNWLDLNFIEENEKEKSFFPEGIILEEKEFKNIKKMIEEDSKPTASITDPKTYQERFVNFITTKVFNEENKKN
ncbi:PIPK domain-containing protein [Meloidogyne graminicola]|uniref:PIPK domain-containing protein n=1 Tax=Meloidogyne graminicola TaxID=189291 RepID=A0A8S9ZSX1_9BILA|nr:PIPK domain-containing protein [Meloidogyne graminicola]